MTILLTLGLLLLALTLVLMRSFLNEDEKESSLDEVTLVGPSAREAQQVNPAPLKSETESRVIVPEPKALPVSNETPDQLPTLVKGRVFNAEGKPAWHAALICRWEGRRRSSDLSTTVSTECDETGGFCIRGERGSGRLRLTAHLEMHTSKEVIVLPGAEGVVIHLESQTRLVGRVVASTDVELGHLYAVLKSQETKFTKVSDLDIDRRFDVVAPPGEYEFLIVEDRHSRVPLIRRRSVRLSAAKITDLGDLRLPASGANIDLLVKLDVQEEDPLFIGRVRFFRPGETSPVQSKSADFYGDPIKLYLREFPADVEVAIHGFRTVRIHVDSKKAEVVLSPAARVQPVLEQADRLGSTPVQVNFSRPGEKLGFPVSESSWSKASETLPVHLFSSGGKLRVHVLAQFRSTDGRWRALELEVEGSNEVQIKEEGTVQRLSISVSPDSLLQLDKLKSK